MKTNRYKICKNCGISKIKKTHFYKNEGAADGYKNVCKSCMGVKNSNPNNLIPGDILNLLKYHKYIKVEYFGFFLGYIIILRKGEYLAYSILKGSYIFKRKTDCKAWLCKKLVKAAKIIEAGLLKRLKDYR